MFSFSFVYGQRDTSCFKTLFIGRPPVDIEKIADSLKLNNIDTFFIYENFFDGESKPIVISKTASKEELRIANCKYVDPIYIYYKTNGKTFVQKLDECYKYVPQQIDTLREFDFFIKNFQIISSDTILINAYISNDGKKHVSMIDHTEKTRIYVSMNGATKNIFIDSLNLSETSIDKKKNINYEHNNNTHLKIFIDMVSESVNERVFTHN